jgi:hypothetical protein
MIDVSITSGPAKETPNLAVKLMSGCPTERILPVDREIPQSLLELTALTNGDDSEI